MSFSLRESHHFCFGVSLSPCLCVCVSLCLPLCLFLPPTPIPASLPPSLICIKWRGLKCSYTLLVCWLVASRLCIVRGLKTLFRPVVWHWLRCKDSREAPTKELHTETDAFYVQSCGSTLLLTDVKIVAVNVPYGC